MEGKKQNTKMNPMQQHQQSKPSAEQPWNPFVSGKVTVTTMTSHVFGQDSSSSLLLPSLMTPCVERSVHCSLNLNTTYSGRVRVSPCDPPGPTSQACLQHEGQSLLMIMTRRDEGSTVPAVYRCTQYQSIVLTILPLPLSGKRPQATKFTLPNRPTWRCWRLRY